MKKIKNTRSFNVKKFGFPGYFPQQNRHLDAISDSIALIQGPCQNLDFRCASTFFPEKIECSFDLNPVLIERQGPFIKKNTDQTEADIGNIYELNPAYERIVFSQPAAIRIMKQGILYPLDISAFSLKMLTPELLFDVFLQEENVIQAQTVYPYGGILPEGKNAIDAIADCTLFWTDDGPYGQISSQKLSVGERVNSHEIHLQVSCHSLRNSRIFSEENAHADANLNAISPEFFGQDPSNCIEKTYVSGGYRMLEQLKMRVFFFPQLE